MNTQSWQQCAVEKVDRQWGSEGGGVGGRRWQEAIRNPRQRQPTSKSLSNLIGVIESFRFLRHWAVEVNTAMKSALTPSPKPPHNDVCNHISSYWTLRARWRQMFGLEMRERRTNRLSFYLWEERDVYKWNTGCNWFRVFNHFSDLFILDHTICRLSDVLHAHANKKS